LARDGFARDRNEKFGFADVLRKTGDEPNVEENVASNGKFFDVESKTIVTIGKYEKEK
jgi:hypothetical protein